MTGAAPDPTRYLAGGTPRAVTVPARVARLIDREIGHKRVTNRGLDREITEVLEALHIAGLEYAATAAGAPDGRTAVPQIAYPPTSTHGIAAPLLDSIAVAERLGCKPRNVRDLALRGRLPGDRVGGKWSFALDVVEGFLADRERRVRTP